MPSPSQAKLLRSRVVADYMAAAGIDSAVCFTCGNAADALRAVGVDVVEVSPRGALVPGRWWAPAEVARCWPRHFDATPGHLPTHLLAQYGAALARAHDHDGTRPSVYVPTGSGETVCALAMAYPDLTFTPVWSDAPATKYEPQAPLLPLVRALTTWDGQPPAAKGAP